MSDGQRRQPPPRQPAGGLTPHQRAVLDAWQSSGQVTLEELARRFSTTPSAICKALAVARAKVYGAAAAGPGRKVRLISLALCFGI